MVRSWDIRTKLQVWEGGNISRAQSFANRVCAQDRTLPRLSSLTLLFDRHQTELTAVVTDFAQRGDQVAREILGIIKPQQGSLLPENEQVRPLQPVFQTIGHKAVLRKGEELVTLHLLGVTFAADLYSLGGQPTRSLAATAYHLVRSPALVAITKKLVLVGDRTEGKMAQQRADRLRDRLITAQFTKKLNIRHELALVELREFPAAAGDLEAVFSQIMSEATLTIPQILMSAGAGVVDSSPNVGTVKL